MTRRSLSLAVFFMGVVILFIAAGIYAGTEMPDVIKLEQKEYEKHTKPIVEFSHKKHSEEYAKNHPEFFDSPCGECHHDENNNALVNLKPGEDVKRCIECHKKPEYVVGRAAKGLSDEQKREYHGNALHDNCRDCHRDYNKKNKLKSKDKGYAPTTCNSCHVKK
jgi:hypothetical protein